MFRYEHVNSARKFTIFAVSLLKNIYIRDGPLRAVFKVNTLAVLFPPYPCEVKQIPRNLYLPPFWRLLVFMEMMQPISTRALSRARGACVLTWPLWTTLWNYGQVQHRKSAIHWLRVTLCMLRVKSDKSDWFWSQSIVFTKPFKPECRWTWPEVAILGADQKKRGL